MSDEDDYGWREWCDNNDFRTGELKYSYEVELAPDAKILYIRTAEELDAFTKEYKDHHSPVNKIMAEVYERHKFSIREEPDVMDLAWRRVAKLYQGIIITPYISERHLFGPIWYNGWDCASGCIWDANAIKSIKEVKLPMLIKEGA